MFGGSGSDSLTSTGGTSLTMVGGTGNATLASSGGTNFTLFGGTGNDLLTSGSDSSGSVIGGSGTDTLSASGDASVTLQGGGSANDRLAATGGTSVTVIGGAGNDTLSATGGTAIALFGLDGNNTYAVSGTAANPISVALNDLSTIGKDQPLTDSTTQGINTITFPGVSGITLDLGITSQGTAAAATPQTVAPGVTVALTGQFQNVIATAGNNWIKGDASTNVLTGGGGNDTLTGGTGPATLVAGGGNDSLVAGSGGTTFQFVGPNHGTDTIDPPTNAGNVLDFSQFGGPVTLNLGLTSPQTVSPNYSPLTLVLQNPAEFNAVIDSGLADQITGNSVGDRFYVGGGSPTITGGGGSDAFYFSGGQLGSDVLNESSTGNTLNFYGFGAPASVNLSGGKTVVSQGPGASLTVSNPSAFTTVVGSPYGGTVQGNNAANETLIGGGGLDSVVAGSGNDYLQGYFTQVVYLSFPAAGQTPPGDHVYTQAEEQAVLAGLQQIYGAFNYTFTLDPAAAQQAAQVTGGPYATLVFDAPVVGGAAGELDPKNLDLGGVARVNIIPFLGDPSAGLVPATGPNIIGLTTTVAAHELGHLSGLTHLDALGPIGTGIYSGMDPTKFFPAYTGPENAVSTPYDVMASPDSVGSTLLDAAGQTFLGERDDIQLAFNDTGTVLQQQNLTTQSATVLGKPATAFVVGDLPALAVPNTLPAGVPGAGTAFNVTAVAVNGALRTATTEDFYAVHGHAGEVMTFQVLSNYDTLNPQPVLNPELALFDASGNTVAYGGNTNTLPTPFLSGAYSLHGFESPDPTLLDVTLPADGTYYVGVDSLLGGSAGNYQLFLYSFGTAATAGGDTLVGGNGNDTMVGSSGNDLFTFQPNATGSATVLGGSGSDVADLSYDPAERLTVTGNVTIKQPLAIPTTSSLGAPAVTYGQHGLVTVTVNGGLYTPTGSVSLSVDGGAAVSGTLAGGTALFDVGVLGAGDHSLSVSYAAQANFVASSTTGTLHVAPATLLVTAGNATKVYGSANPTFADAITGFVNEDTSSVVTGAASLTTTATASSGVGNYTITAALGTLSAANYTFAFVNGTLAVTPATLTVTATSLSKVYGQTNPALTYTLAGFVNGDTSSAVGGAPGLSTTATTSSGVGNYTITVTAGTLAAANYSFSFVNGNLTITPATLTVTATSLSKVYGSANPTLTDTITGFVNGDTSSVVSGAPTLATTATASSGVGSYPITVTAGTLSAANYTFALVNGTLTVTPAMLRVMANNLTKVYAQADPPLTYTITGYTNGDTPAVVGGSPILSTTATASSGVGSYPITITAGTLSAVNYAFAFFGGTLTVTPAPLTVTATSLSKVYGQANPTLTYTITGFVNGDTSSVVSGSPSLSTTATASSGVGNYTITVTAGTLSAANYSFTFANGTLAVTRAPLTVTATSLSKVYGSANPTLTYTLAGFVNGDTSSVVSGSPTLTTTATASSGVGTYTITVTAGTLSAANYSFTFANGTLSVTPASLIVAANSLSKVYGQVNPTLTYTITGFVNGDPHTVVSGAPLLTTSATASSGVGSYPITITAGTLSAVNYVFAFLNGTLSVTPATLTVTANNASKVYGQANPTFTDTITGFVNGDTSKVVSGAASLTTTATTTSAVGNYTIAAALGTLGAANYTFAFVNGTLTISKDGTTTAVSSSTFNFGQTATFTATVTANAPGSGTPTGGVDFFDTTAGFDLGSATLSGGSATLTTSALPFGSQTIAASYGGDGSFLASTYTLTVVNGASVFVLDPKVSGALTLSGAAAINVPGTVVVDSSASAALSASGSAQVTASGIQVVGGVQASSTVVFSPTPRTGVTPVSDPLGGLSGPGTTGLTNYGSVNFSTGSHTLKPGVYSQIAVSGSATVTLNPGTYIIEGGGLTVTNGGSISGAGVFLYNAGSNYPSSGGTFGGITLSGSGTLSLTAPTSGPYAGVVIYQSPQNTRGISLSNSASGGITGVIYAKNALLTLSGNANLQLAVVVDTLNLSSSVKLSQTAAGGGGTGDVLGIADTLLAGNLNVYVRDPGGFFTADERARVRDAIAGLDTLLAPYSVTITQVSDSASANLVLDAAATSTCGGAADGVLGCFNGDAGEATIVEGWDWYAGADPAQIGATQYDFQTVVTHELGHALGLGGRTDPNSPMNEILPTGMARRTMTVADLNIPEPPDGADPERAAPPPSAAEAPAPEATLSEPVAAPQAVSGRAAAHEAAAGGQALPAVALGPQAGRAVLPPGLPLSVGPGASGSAAAPALPPPGSAVFVRRGDVAFLLGGAGADVQVWAVDRDRLLGGRASGPPDPRRGRATGTGIAAEGGWDQGALSPEALPAGLGTEGVAGLEPVPGIKPRLPAPGPCDRFRDGVARFGLDEAAFVLALLLAGTEPSGRGAAEEPARAPTGRRLRGAGR
jgi:hypothetical protein